MEKVTSIEEGVKKLLILRDREVPEFTYKHKAEGEYVDTLLYDGKEIPVFDDHYNAHMLYIAQYGEETEKNSALNVYSFVGSDVSLNELMFREMYIAEYVLHSRIVSVTAFMKPNAANMILVMKDGTAANIDLGNTMAPGSINQCQHRLITAKGAACDRGAGDYTVTSLLNVFSSEKTEPIGYDDDQLYLYGLSDVDVQKACTVHAILTGQVDYSDWNQRKARYLEAIEAAYTSDAEGRTVVLTK